MQKLKDKRDEVKASSMNNIIDYFSLIPMTVKPRDIGEKLQIFVTNLANVFQPSEQINFILKMTTFRHIPTYAHSIMVGKIASCLTGFLIVRNPGCFVGCMEIARAEHVGDRAAELCLFAETGGLFHDIGKITYAGNPFMQARKLTDEEFEIIKRHPSDGHKMMLREDGSSLHEGYSDIILGHHKYFDNSGGYPDNFDITKSKDKIMVDIIAAADSIESATDDIGRIYADVKDLETICAEITEGAGSRYSPDIARLFEDRAVMESLGAILAEGRRMAYYTAYLHAWN
jgi:response regulator RpfG family c-di-GMP phosphodiesterase